MHGLQRRIRMEESCCFVLQLYRVRLTRVKSRTESLGNAGVVINGKEWTADKDVLKAPTFFYFNFKVKKTLFSSSLKKISPAKKAQRLKRNVVYEDRRI